MKYAIIAAGEGSRLANEGIATPKPLVKVGGEMLIDRLIRIFLDNEAEEIVIICNDQSISVRRHLMEMQTRGLGGRNVPLKFIVMSTESSMHSFFEISPYLAGGPFVLTTVDTIFDEQLFARFSKTFAEAAENKTSDGIMAVTDFIDDESPLYVDTDDNGNITGFYDVPGDYKYVSGGIYGLTPISIVTLRECIGRGEKRMRNFQRALLKDGMRLKAFPMGKILDIDHKEDVEKAELFLK